jgi:hypothetical protein
VTRPAVTAESRAALSTEATEGSADRQAMLWPGSAWRRASTTRATIRATPPSGTRSTESP